PWRRRAGTPGTAAGPGARSARATPRPDAASAVAPRAASRPAADPVPPSSTPPSPPWPHWGPRADISTLEKPDICTLGLQAHVRYWAVRSTSQDCPPTALPDARLDPHHVHQGEILGAARRAHGSRGAAQRPALPDFADRLANAM